MDGPIATPSEPLLSNRSPPSSEQDGNLHAISVHQCAGGVRCTHDDMNHHYLRFSGYHGVAHRHTYRNVFMRDSNRAGSVFFLYDKFCQPIYNGRKISSAITEDVFYPPVSKHLQVGLSHGFDRYLHIILYRFFPELPAVELISY